MCASPTPVLPGKGEAGAAAVCESLVSLTRGAGGRGARSLGAVL